MSETNSYSRSWFEFFHLPILPERTAREVEFICEMAPLPEFSKVLDICCGMGRHARALASRGYLVTGVERDAAAIARARETGGGPSYIQADVRDYQPEKSAYDLAIIMSQSFGYFDSETNRDVLQQIAVSLRKHGRLILDLWNLDFFRTHQGERSLESPVGIVREEKHVHDGRLRVHLTYPDSTEEDFDWQLLTPEQMGRLAEIVELSLITACSEFDRVKKPKAANPRIQFVLQKS